MPQLNELLKQDIFGDVTLKIIEDEIIVQSIIPVLDKLKQEESKMDSKPKKKGAFPCAKKYDVFKDGVWTICDSQQEAAQLIGCHVTIISKELKGKDEITVKGCKVRLHSYEELDKTLEEIEKRSKEPYHFTK